MFNPIPQRYIRELPIYMQAKVGKNIFNKEDDINEH